MQAEQIQNSCCKNNGNVKYEFYLYISKLVHSYIMLNNLPRISRWALMFGGSGSFVFVKVNSICFKWQLSLSDWYRINIFTLFTRTLHIQCMWNLKVTIKKFCRSEISLIRFTKSSLQIACKLMCLHIETAFAHWNSICSSKLQVATKLSFENSSGVCEWDFFCKKCFLEMVGCFIKTTINGKWILRTPDEFLFVFGEVSKWNDHLDMVLNRLLYVTPEFRCRQFCEQLFSTVSWKTVFWSSPAHMTSKE